MRLLCIYTAFRSVCLSLSTPLLHTASNQKPDGGKTWEHGQSEFKAKNAIKTGWLESPAWEQGYCIHIIHHSMAFVTCTHYPLYTHSTMLKSLGLLAAPTIHTLLYVLCSQVASYHGLIPWHLCPCCEHSSLVLPHCLHTIYVMFLGFTLKHSLLIVLPALYYIYNVLIPCSQAFITGAIYPLCIHIPYLLLPRLVPKHSEAHSLFSNMH